MAARWTWPPNYPKAFHYHKTSVRPCLVWNGWRFPKFNQIIHFSLSFSKDSLSAMFVGPHGPGEWKSLYWFPDYGFYRTRWPQSFTLIGFRLPFAFPCSCCCFPLLWSPEDQWCVLELFSLTPLISHGNIYRCLAYRVVFPVSTWTFLARWKLLSVALGEGFSLCPGDLFFLNQGMHMYVYTYVHVKKIYLLVYLFVHMSTHLSISMCTYNIYVYLCVFMCIFVEV